MRKTDVAEVNTKNQDEEEDEREKDEGADDEEEEDEDEEEDDEDEAPESAALASSPAPRRRRGAANQAPTYPSEWSAVFGTPPRNAYAWGLYRKDPGAINAPCTHNDGTGVLVGEWPIPELSGDIIRERWGAGTYQLSWKCHREGKRVAYPGKLVRIAPAPPAPPPVAAVPPLPPGMVAIQEEQLRKLLAMADGASAQLTPEERAIERIERIRAQAQEGTLALVERMARIFGGGRGAAPSADAQELQERRMVDVMRRVVREEIGEPGDDDEPDESGEPAPAPETWSDVGDILGGKAKATLVSLATDPSTREKLKELAPVLLDQLRTALGK